MGIVGDVGTVTNIANAYVSKPKVADSENKPKTITVLGSKISTDSTEGMQIERTTTPQVGPTIANAEKLEAQRNASNPFKRNGSHAGSQVYKDLDYGLIDWTTGQLKTPFLSATMKTEENT